jgi:hypothetical protein
MQRNHPVNLNWTMLIGLIELEILEGDAWVFRLRSRFDQPVLDDYDGSEALNQRHPITTH